MDLRAYVDTLSIVRPPRRSRARWLEPRQSGGPGPPHAAPAGSVAMGRRPPEAESAVVGPRGDEVAVRMGDHADHVLFVRLRTTRRGRARLVMVWWCWFVWLRRWRLGGWWRRRRRRRCGRGGGLVVVVVWWWWRRQRQRRCALSTRPRVGSRLDLGHISRHGLGQTLAEGRTSLAKGRLRPGPCSLDQISAASRLHLGQLSRLEQVAELALSEVEGVEEAVLSHGVHPPAHKVEAPL